MKLPFITLLCFMFSAFSASPPVLAQLNADTALKLAASSGKPTLVDFSAAWCVSCNRLDPVIKAIAKDKDLAGRINVVVVDVDNAEKLAARYRIQSLPVLILLDRSGQEIRRHFGYIEKESLKKLIKSSIK